ncbi:MAG: DUF2341 domain-containing protein, partial [Promethearchaeota archaeon]
SLKLAFSLPGSTHKLLGTSDVTTNTWHHVVATYDGANIRVYIDGTLEGILPKTDAIKGTSQEQDFWIGHGDQPQDKAWSAEWEGQLDEIRVSDIGRSGDWIETEYANQGDPNSFYSVSSEESYGSDDWAFKVFRFRRNITFDSTQVSADLTNFPVLIEIFESDLHSLENVQADGDDIIFVDSSNTKLNHEIEYFDQEYNSTHAHLITWVNVPNLSSSSDTVITMYYGNPALPSQENSVDIWNNNYTGVWHLDEVSGGHYDSAADLENGLIHGTVNQDTNGTFDGGDELLGISTESWIEIENSPQMISNSAFTVEAWIYLQTLPSTYVGLVQHSREADINWYGLWIDDNNRINCGWDWRVGGNIPGSSLSTGQWYYAVATYDGTNRRLYLDGSLDAGPSSGSYATDSENWHIGTDGNGNYFDGTIDEVRISSAARSADWINTTYNNLNNPSGFYSIDEEEIYSNWWADKSFNSRRDIVIDQSLDENPLILRPNGVGTTNLISTEYPISGVHWELVSDENDTTYVEQDDTNVRRDTYQVEDINGIIGTINSVTVKVRVISSSTTDVAAEVEMITHGSLYTNSAAWHNNSQWWIYSRTWTNNPYTSQPWTVAEINNMEIGVELKGETGGNSRCSEVWAEVNYTIQEESLSNFPVLIKVTDSSFREGNVQSDAADFIFVDANGAKLAHEIEFFSQNATHGDLTVWVKIPELSLIDQNVVSMYYGNSEISNQENPSPVWDSNYAGVWHLGETSGGSLAIKDSTTNYNHGTNYGTVELGVSGQINGGIGIDAFADYISIADSSSLDITTNLTISVWTKADYYIWSLPIIAKNESPNSPYGIRYINNSNQISYNLEGVTSSQVDSGVTANREVWMFVVLTYDGSNVNIYTNGNLEYSASNSGTITSNNQPLLFGREEYYSDTYRGYMDEVRVSSNARSAEWIATEYLNQFNPDTFYTLGPRMSISSNIIVEETVSIGGADVTQLTTPNITGVENDLYLLSVSMKPYLDVSTVTGLGLTWTEIEDQPAGRSQTGVSVWYAQGNNPTTGGVTVTLAAQAAGFAVSLTRISGVNYVDPIGVTETANTNGIDGIGTDGIDSTNANVTLTTSYYGSLVLGIAATRINPFTPALGYTQIDVITGATSGSQARVTSFQKATPVPAYINVNGTNSEVDWAIAGIEIKPAIIDINPPIIDDFGIDDLGNGNGAFWAKIHDLESSTTKVDIKINGTVYSMSDNGTHWIYQVTPNFDDFYDYQLFNTTDSWGNSLEFPTDIKYHTFDYDNLAPTVQDWEYVQVNNTFQANVTDTWGEIDTVRVNVTTYSMVATMVYYTTFSGTILAYMNDTLSLPNGPMDFLIIVNDTEGNEYTSSTHSGSTFSNNPPVAENLTLTPATLWSNTSLTLSYDYYDADSHPEDGTEIRWYKYNGTAFKLQTD